MTGRQVDTQVDTQAADRVASISSIRVDKADGRVFLYLSLDYIPVWEFRRWRKYRRAIKAHVDFAGEGAKVFVECPAHPIPALRRRRCLKR